MPRTPLHIIAAIASMSRGLDPDEVMRRYSKPAIGSEERQARLDAVSMAIKDGYTRAQIARGMGLDWATVHDYCRDAGCEVGDGRRRRPPPRAGRAGA